MKKLIEKFLQRQVRIIANSNPKAITVSEIARFYFIPHWFARFILNVGTWDGTFVKNSDGTYKHLTA